MRKTIAVIAAMIIAGCSDYPQPLEPLPEEPSPEHTTYTGHDATVQIIEAIRTGLADPVQLELNAELNGQTVEERRSLALQAIETLENRIAGPGAMASAAAPCDPNADFSTLWTEVSYIPPLWEGSPVGEQMRVTGYTSVYGAAKLATSVSAYHGRLRDWRGPPATGAEYEYHAEGSTSTCQYAMAVRVSFAPTFRPGYTWGLTSHRFQRGNGSWKTHSTDAVGFNPGPRTPVGSADAHDEDESGESVDPTAHRLVLTITPEGSVLPKLPVTLRIEGVAMEPIDGGEVVVTLPTQASIDYAGLGNRLRYPAGQKLPIMARWKLPQLAKGAQWKERVEIPAMEKGYYQIAVNAYTDGPLSDLGPYLADDVYRQVWMFVLDRGAEVTSFFDGSRFPEGMLPVPGPFRRLPTSVDSASADHGTASADKAKPRGVVYAEVTYYHSSELGFQPAVDARISGAYYRYGSGSGRREETRTVPDNGIVSFPCPSANEYLKGRGTLPQTDYVKGKSGFVSYWSAHNSSCGDTITVQGYRDKYMPWNHLNKSAELITDHFTYSRGPVAWRVDHREAVSRYRWGLFIDEIVFGYAGYDERWVAAHEYTHALHNKGMGGSWSTNCPNHTIRTVSSYRCAFAEGLADYGGNVGAPGDDYAGGDWENWDRGIGSPKGKIEGYVAALFHDLLDGGSETGDETDYRGSYVMTVFKTCTVTEGYSRPRDRSKVSDFIWCLENRIDEDVHDDHFPGVDAPQTARERATEPSNWSADDIRSTWIKNVG